MTNDERLATLPEAAEHAGVSIRTLLRWIAAGHLTAHRTRVGTRRTRVDLNEIDRVQQPVAG